MRKLAAVAVVIAVLAGAALIDNAIGSESTAPTTATLPAACEDSMADAAAEPDPTAADPLIERTLIFCADAVDWIAALQRHPAAMGLKSRDAVTDFAVYTACGNDRTSRVCADAAARGVLD